MSLQANSPEIQSTDIDRIIMHLLKFKLQEVISINKNNNSNAAVRLMKREAVFQKALVPIWVVHTDTSDIHTLEDIRKIYKKMKTNKIQRKVKIIAEVHPQFMGSMNELERMIIQCKANGADYVKVQLYNSKKLFNNNDREFLEISKKEFLNISDYSKRIGIKLFASIFDEEKIDWCEEAGGYL